MFSSYSELQKFPTANPLCIKTDMGSPDESLLPKKALMVIENIYLIKLNQGDETGIGFYIIEIEEEVASKKFTAVTNDGVALPLYTDNTYYCIDDLLAGVPIPKVTKTSFLGSFSHFSNRHTAINALQSASISPKYVGYLGAFPLIATYTLKNAAVFHRYIKSGNDPNFNGIQLKSGTYLTSTKDSNHATSGFGAVGRYALPIPLPASHVIQYELPQGTKIEIGTVAPNFGQSGGGVEVRLPKSTAATVIGYFKIPDY